MPPPLPPAPALSASAIPMRTALNGPCPATGGEGAARGPEDRGGTALPPAGWRSAVGALPWRSIPLVLAGAAAMVALVLWSGFGDVAEALELAGWALVPLAAAHVVPLGLDAAAWWTLAPPPRPRLPVFLLARWIREGVNALLPVAQIGGEAVAVRVLAGRGGGAGWFGAIVALDLAAEFASMVLFGAAATVVLLREIGPDRQGQGIAVAAAMVPPALVALALLLAPRFGLLARAARRVGPRWPALAAGLRDAEAAFRAIRSRPSALLRCIGLHGLGWAAGAAETWAVLLVLGHAVSPERAFALEGTTEVLRAFGFAVPGMLAVQEGSLIVVGGLLGLAPADAVALSLFRRARDVALGLPALGAWWLWSRRTASAPDAPGAGQAAGRPSAEERAWTS